MSSTDLKLLKGLPKLRIPSATEVGTNQLYTGITCSTSRDVAGGESDGSGPVTPTSEEHRIPAVLSCPPAPRKPKRKASCRRKLLELEFFEIVNREEVESFFRSSFDEHALSKRRRPCK